MGPTCLPGGSMKRGTIFSALALCLVATAVCFAANLHMGTWKLNEAKSKIAPGTGKNTTVVYEAVGNDIKVTVDGTGADGQPTHNEWTGKFNGKFYAVTGDPTGDMRSYTKVNSRTLSIHETKGGKVVLTGTITVARNGKSRTVRATAKNPQGKWTTNTAVYDKQ